MASFYSAGVSPGGVFFVLNLYSLARAAILAQYIKTEK